MKLRLALPFCALLALALAARASRAPVSQDTNAAQSKGQYWRGNLHTHTLWSDGDGAPELVVAAYKELGYHFLSLTEHNTLAKTERWFPVSEDGTRRLIPAHLGELAEAFGQESVSLRERSEGGREMLLHTLSDLRERFEQPDRFLLVTGEEVTASYRQKEPKVRDYPVHVNAWNIRSYVAPRGSDSPRDLMNAAVTAIHTEGPAKEGASGPILAGVNHPNYQYALTWEDLAEMRGDRFFEVFNGHRGTANYGDPDHPSLESMWDLANLRRRTELDLPLLFGIATDDAHNYHGDYDQLVASPNRGWVMVRSQELAADSLMRALSAGDFYASSGIALTDIRTTANEYRIDIEMKEGVSYKTRFIGARKGSVQTLHETSEDPAIYRFLGDELFVRAVVTSDELHPNPFLEGDVTLAWCQPVVPQE